MPISEKTLPGTSMDKGASPERDPAPYPAGLLRGMLVAALWVGVRSLRLHVDALHEHGFATSVIGNAITIEDEEYKLRTIVETPGRVWG
jgi:hypothetical protein